MVRLLASSFLHSSDVLRVARATVPEHAARVSLESTIRAFGPRFLGRELRARDGVPERSLAAAERRLGLRLPRSLRLYYRLAGRCDELNHAHNHVVPPRELEVLERHLVFMDENQNVVSWGIRLADLHRADPTVRQRNNTPPEAWYSERMSVTEFLDETFVECGPGLHEESSGQRVRRP
jgi:hypothetical protein